jgi:hypothetical protein
MNALHAAQATRVTKLELAPAPFLFQKLASSFLNSSFLSPPTTIYAVYIYTGTIITYFLKYPFA